MLSKYLIQQLEVPCNTRDFQWCLKYKPQRKNHNFLLISGNLKGSCNARVTGLCFLQNLKLRSHIHSPKSQMHKSMGKSRCKFGDLNWMEKQNNKTYLSVSSSQRPPAVHSEQLKRFGVSAWKQSSFLRALHNIHLLKCLQGGLLSVYYATHCPFARCCKRY